MNVDIAAAGNANHEISTVVRYANEDDMILLHRFIDRGGAWISGVDQAEPVGYPVLAWRERSRAR